MSASQRLRPQPPLVLQQWRQECSICALRTVCRPTKRAVSSMNHWQTNAATILPEYVALQYRVYCDHAGPCAQRAYVDPAGVPLWGRSAKVRLPVAPADGSQTSPGHRPEAASAHRNPVAASTLETVSLTCLQMGLQLPPHRLGCPYAYVELGSLQSRIVLNIWHEDSDPAAQQPPALDALQRARWTRLQSTTCAAAALQTISQTGSEAVARPPRLIRGPAPTAKLDCCICNKVPWSPLATNTGSGISRWELASSAGLTLAALWYVAAEPSIWHIRRHP